MNDSLSPQPFSGLPPHNQTTKKINGLHGCSVALTLSQTTSKPLFIIATDSHHAKHLQKELQTFAPKRSTFLFPDWEVLPYDRFSPHPDLVSKRMAILNRLATKRPPDFLIAAASTSLMRLCPPSYIIKNTLIIRINEQIRRGNLIDQLTKHGYQHCSEVKNPGELTIKGSLIDLFPNGSQTPFRIDFFDDEIESIRRFDPESQASTKPVDQIHILPAREYDTNNSIDVNNPYCSYLEKSQLTRLHTQRHYQGECFYKPAYHHSLMTLFEWVTPIMDVVSFEKTSNRISQQIKLISAQHAITHHPLPISALYMNENDWLKQSKAHYLIHQQTANQHQPTEPIPDCALKTNNKNPLEALESLMKTHKVAVFCETEGRAHTLNQLIDQHHKKWPIISFEEFSKNACTHALIPQYIHEGCLIKKAKTALIRDQDLNPEQIIQRRTRDQKQQVDWLTLNELSPNKLVIHKQYGLGYYEGIKELTHDGITQDFLNIRFSDDQYVYLACEEVNLLSRYHGQKTVDDLDSLNKKAWGSRKKKADDDVERFAFELIEHQKNQRQRIKKSYFIPKEYYDFQVSFPYEETPDQKNAINDILDDLRSRNPMNRLVCGDVGFGKTEVAMRAAYMAVANGKQVLVLAPTTLLAVQHLESFQHRFAAWPISITGLTRLNTTSKCNKISEDFEQGNSDILISTHKILFQINRPEKLDLIIIDEEHRFGVLQKEKLKNRYPTSNQLWLSATPIPRTLNQALSKLRSLSLISTPPAKRAAVITHVKTQDDQLLKEALLREINRGGQAFIVRNHIESLANRKKAIKRLLPDLKLEILHGQSSKKELTQIMKAFYRQEFDVLLTTTIIESGIDIPSANTLIIEQSDRMGLAQLHQLRGRVGRSHHQAYCYLFVDQLDLLNTEAKQRLSALCEHQKLGSGFHLAMRDLEIRGSGQLLGKEQSGHINHLGYHLYMETLNRALNAKGDQSNTLMNTEIESGPLDCRIPKNYISDANIRVYYYQQISQIYSIDALNELQANIVDRFGRPPASCEQLIQKKLLKITASSLGILLIRIKKHDIDYTCCPRSFKHHDQIMTLVQNGILHLSGPNGFTQKISKASFQCALNFLRELI